jgi:hypothetical protein
MRLRLRSGLMRLPGGVGYRMARAFGVRSGPALSTPSLLPPEPPSENGSGNGPLTVELDDKGRRKRLRVRAADDIWSEDFRKELAADRGFEASLAWRELVILIAIAAILAARTIFGG